MKLLILLTVKFLLCHSQLKSEEYFGEGDTCLTSYITSIMYKHFSFDKPVGITRIFSSTSCRTCENSLDLLLEQIADLQHWPLIILDVDYAEELTPSTIAVRDGYVLFLCLISDDKGAVGATHGRNESYYEDYKSVKEEETETEEEEHDEEEEQEDCDPMEMLENIVKRLLAYNAIKSNTKFLIVLSGMKPEEISPSLPKTIFEVLWETARIINVVLVDGTIKELPYVDDGREFLESYTWFPYIDGNCHSVANIELLDQSLLGDTENISDVDFFPGKLPNNFKGCLMRITPYGLGHYVIVSNYTDNKGNIIYKDNSLGSEIVQLFAEKHNLKTTVVNPVLNFGMEETGELLFGVQDNETDFAVGTIPVMRLIQDYMDTSLPIIFEDARPQVPCPRTVPRVERIMSIFTKVTWISLGLFYLLAGFMLWLISNTRKTLRRSESNSFRKIAQCFYSTWAILLGVSVPEMPKTESVRWFFIFYVGYCFAVSMVFQAFFTTFLVEPGYGNLIVTADKVFGRGVAYGYIDTLEMLAPHYDYTDHLKAKTRVNYSDIIACVERCMFKADITLLVGVSIPYYVALKNGIHDVNKFVCFGPHIFMTAQLSIGVHRGHPILPLLDTHITRSFEGGFVEEYWSALKHTYKLQAIKRDEDDMYFVFSMNHMQPVFVLLLCGYVVCFVVFVFELFSDKVMILLRKYLLG
jgi:Ligand-gated ion channel.